ncbi:MAG TPA: WYL domain-containing protein [Gemmatimonadales bacterium]|nr:WYL domain-containing protein [Gemmatimonadales bacterium]
MSAVKLERLLNLTAALLETARPLTAEQVRERVPGYPEDKVAFRRAFSRDKEDLRELGIPLRIERVVVEDRAVEGYRVPPEDYYLRDPGLSADELAALHLAARVVRLEGATEALWKLGGDTTAPGSETLGDLAVPAVDLPTDERLTALFAALVDRHAVRFDYPSGRKVSTSPASAPEERVVDPHRLDFQRGRWYLSGYDHGRDALRSFRVDRIVGDVRILEDRPFPRPANRHPGVRLQPWELGEETATALLLVDPEQAPWAIAHLGRDAVEERRPDGSAVLRVAVANRDAFRSFVLTFLDHAEVLSPPELRRDVVDWLSRIAEDSA